MVAPIGADVDLFLEAHHLQVNFLFWTDGQLRTVVTSGQILTRHQTTVFSGFRKSLSGKQLSQKHGKF